MTRYSLLATRWKSKSILLATAAMVVAGANPEAALAQDAAQPAETSNPGEDIVVTGFRNSLIIARDIKKTAVIQMDVIVAEDMAKFPELNLAESLQRLPGVQITREAGEGRRISLRGLGPDFARVQLNGMEVLGNVDSAQDSRGQRSRDRAFDFNIFASELFSRVEVEKTFQAAQNEGGMAGTVGLFTGKPFDYASGTKGALVVKGGSNQYTKDGQFRVAGLLSHNWDNRFGITISAAYSERKTSEQGHNTYNYSHLGKTETVDGKLVGDAVDLVNGGLDISHLSAEKQARFMAGDLYFADGNRISSWNAKQQRLGITASVQWRPADNLLLTLDGLHGEFTTHRDELHLATRPIHGLGSTTLDTAAGSPWPSQFNSPTVLNDFNVDANNYVTMTNASNVTFGSEHRRELNKNKFNQLALTGKWDASDRLTIDGHVGYEKSNYDTPYDDKFYMRAKGNLVADYGADGRSATFTYPGFDTTKAANYAMDNFYYRSFYNSSELLEGVLNLRYKATDALTVRAGGAYHRFTQDGASYFYDGGDNGTTKKARGTSITGITDVFSNSFGSWLVGNYDRGFAKYNEYHRLVPNSDGTGGVLVDIENVYKTKEETVSGYLQLDLDTELFGKHLRGNVGLRGYHTNTRSQGWIQGDSYAYLGTADVKGSYSGVLPALNAVLDITDETLVRFAATQNLNRPSLGSMAAQGKAFKNEDTGEISASRGNPNLKPFKDTTLDFSVEHYFGKVGLVSASVFHKWIKNFIGSQDLSNVRFGDIGIPISSIPGATADTIVKSYSIPINIAGTKSLTGVELAAQSQLSFLPAPFDKLGVLANFTYVDADEALTGISDVSYNATVYYETDKWGMRGSMSHRNRWYTGHNSDPMSADTRGFEGSTYVDASAFFNITPKLQVTVNAINLTNAKDTQFWGQARYLYNQTQSGTTYMGGIAYKF
ncbi:TonB-dependent receptor [Novosphingobium sp.]|uniref:TonB-dependent receptor n=1 Tax=Novosphingobium sp. TaxID=1874826 RepID=UPI0038BD75FB